MTCVVSLSACGPAGGPDGRMLAIAQTDAGLVVRTSSDAGVMMEIDAGGPPPGCPSPTLESLREEVFVPTCSTGACHGGPTARLGLDLSLPLGQLRPRLSQAAMQSPSNLRLIEPNAIGSSYLYLKVFLPAPGIGERMPPGGQLKACELQALKDWINAGAVD